MPHHEPPASRRGTDGFVYRGDPDLVHITDGKRRMAGEAIADFVDTQTRQMARLRGETVDGKSLCPGCYMPAIFNAAVALALRNEQDVRELGLTLSAAFLGLAETLKGVDGIEDIHVVEVIN